MSESGQPEVVIYEDEEQGLTIFGLDDGDGQESMFGFSPEIADEIADRLKASAAKVRAMRPERVQ
jgi:hypothetical protein